MMDQKQQLKFHTRVQIWNKTWPNPKKTKHWHPKKSIVMRFHPKVAMCYPKITTSNRVRYGKGTRPKGTLIPLGPVSQSLIC
jgi:hypothetical protein